MPLRPQMCAPLSHPPCVYAPSCGHGSGLWVWVFMCVHTQMPPLCASLHESLRGARVRACACVAGHGLCLPALCESISGHASLCLYVRE